VVIELYILIIRFIILCTCVYATFRVQIYILNTIGIFVWVKIEFVQYLSRRYRLYPLKMCSKIFSKLYTYPLTKKCTRIYCHREKLYKKMSTSPVATRYFINGLAMPKTVIEICILSWKWKQLYYILFIIIIELVETYD